MFDPFYISALKTSYSNQVSVGYLEMDEKELDLGAEFLSQKLSVEQQTILSNIEFFDIPFWTTYDTLIRAYSNNLG